MKALARIPVDREAETALEVELVYKAKGLPTVIHFLQTLHPKSLQFLKNKVMNGPGVQAHEPVGAISPLTASFHPYTF